MSEQHANDERNSGRDDGPLAAAAQHEITDSRVIAADLSIGADAIIEPDIRDGPSREGQDNQEQGDDDGHRYDSGQAHVGGQDAAKKNHRSFFNEQRVFGLRGSDAMLGDGVVSWFNFNADELAAGLDAGHAG